ncbi:Clostripain family, putative [Angomonas deanei]|uniref:Clostripain family, putative n=1 Tax=Angomonas deanei TaxID=59799 RepID=A0A7G2CUA0_9TRYP|nr:Clostripain family, putative [Angomonas deanei]
MLCTSVNDVTAWPFWKLLQMKKLNEVSQADGGVRDLAMIAFNTNGGSFIARIEGKKYTFKNFPKIKKYNKEMFLDFLEEYYIPNHENENHQNKKKQYFVYGGHGMGDYLEFEQHKSSLQCHELADMFNHPRAPLLSKNNTNNNKYFFDAILFDACFMGNLDSAYYLRHNTNYILASEGYVWEPDTALDHHILNNHAASLLSNNEHDTLDILLAIQKRYCENAARGDISILSTREVEKLKQYVNEFVIPRVWQRADFYSLPQRALLSHYAETNNKKVDEVFGEAGGTEGKLMSVVGNMKTTTDTEEDDDEVENEENIKRFKTVAEIAMMNINILQNNNNPNASADQNNHNGTNGEETTQNHKNKDINLKSVKNRNKLLKAIQFEHALYPSETEDKHLVDLKSYLLDIKREKDENKNNNKKEDFPSRVRVIEKHGKFPAESTLKDPNALLQNNHHNSENNNNTNIQTVEEALAIFDRVVVSHQGPAAKELYAAVLHGLSISIHEYSRMSRPRHTWGTYPAQNGNENNNNKVKKYKYYKTVAEAKKMLHQRAKLFLRRGVSPTVSEREVPQDRPTPQEEHGAEQHAMVAAEDRPNTSHLSNENIQAMLSQRPKRHLFKRLRSPTQ